MKAPGTVERDLLRVVERAARRVVKFSGPWSADVSHTRMLSNMREAHRAKDELAKRLAELDEHRRAK